MLRNHTEIWHRRTKGLCSAEDVYHRATAVEVMDRNGADADRLSPSPPPPPSQSSSHEHQVMTITHLSIVSSTFRRQCAFYCRAVMMYINKRGVSTFRLSA